MTDVRIERDCLGEMEIPNDQYYGCLLYTSRQGIEPTVVKRG